MLLWGHPSARAVLQMPPLNLGTVSLFARRDPRNRTVETIVCGEEWDKGALGNALCSPKGSRRGLWLGEKGRTPQCCVACPKARWSVSQNNPSHNASGRNHRQDRIPRTTSCTFRFRSGNTPWLAFLSPYPPIGVSQRHSHRNVLRQAPTYYRQ